MLEFIVITINIFALGASAVAIYQLFKASKLFITHTSPKVESTDLPSVTVCIPARNEDHALTDCLHKVLASDYEKLEIIVVDDNSVDNTSVLIKSFAHAGVRFVAGSELPEGWLGKNHSLQTLLSEASGSYIFFMDVDTRLQPDSISKVVDYALKEQATMVSILPRREDGWRTSILFSPLRYFWEVIFNKKGSPAAVGNAWLIDRKKLVDYGGFGTMSFMTRPESQLAAYFSTKRQYRFLISNAFLGISFEKKWLSQLLTSIRLMSPQVDGSLSAILLIAIDLLLLASLPLMAVSWTIFPLWYLSAFTSLVLSLTYTFYAYKMWAKAWPLAFVLWPVIVLQEALLVVTSYIMHKTGKVTWKGRPLKTPVRS